MHHRRALLELLELLELYRCTKFCVAPLKFPESNGVYAYALGWFIFHFFFFFFMEAHFFPMLSTRALQWSGNPYGNGYGLEMDGNGAQFVKRLWIGLDLGEGHRLKTIQ